MMWLKVITGILSLAKSLMGFARDRQLISAGEAKALAKQSSRSLDIIRQAQAARRALGYDPDSVQSDPDNRDNKRQCVCGARTD